MTVRSLGPLLPFDSGAGSGKIASFSTDTLYCGHRSTLPRSPKRWACVCWLDTGDSMCDTGTLNQLTGRAVNYDPWQRDLQVSRCRVVAAGSGRFGASQTWFLLASDALHAWLYLDP